MFKKILVISPVPFAPQDAGNRARIYGLLVNLQKLGHEVHFLHIEQEIKDVDLMRQAWGDKFYSLPYTGGIERKRSLSQKIVRKLRCYFTGYPKYPNAIDDWYDNSVNKFLVELHDKVKFDVVITEYVFFSKFLQCFGKDVLKIIDTHDIFANRAEIYRKRGQKYYWFSTTVKEEIKGLRRADLILSIQKDEEKYFQNLIGNKVITVGHTVSLRQPRYISEVRQKILFVASNNDTNIHGINYFIHEVFPKVRIKLHDVQLLIAGNICDVIQDDEDLIKLGYVNNLNDIYDTSDIVINPILFGTGLKIKTIEALGQSKVLITTPEGAKGLERGDKKAFLIANDSEEFAEFLIETLTNLVLSRNLSNNAYSFAKNYNEELFHPLEKYLNNNISPSIEKNENNICHI